jgi:hypothetical protein
MLLDTRMQSSTFQLSSLQYESQFVAYRIAVVLQFLSKGDFLTPTSEETLVQDQRRVWTSRGADCSFHWLQGYLLYKQESHLGELTVFHVTHTMVQCHPQEADRCSHG